MGLIRLPDWETRLLAEISAAGTRRWRWGDHDCVTLAARLVAAMTGQSVPLPAWRSRQDAERAIRLMGGLAAGVESLLGSAVAWAEARRGDVVLYRLGRMDSLAVSVGAQLVAADRRGVAFLPLSMAASAWRIG